MSYMKLLNNNILLSPIIDKTFSLVEAIFKFLVKLKYLAILSYSLGNTNVINAVGIIFFSPVCR